MIKKNLLNLSEFQFRNNYQSSALKAIFCYELIASQMSLVHAVTV